MLEDAMKDPIQEFQSALTAMRDDIGKDKTYELIKSTMEALIGTQTKKKSKL
jgi:hypothetical protein